jgi:glucosamine--fructose-6-phosphate aminotransferase (isomerizing)
MKGLHRLEYRGYDSAGVALISDSGALNIYKAKGKVNDLETATRGSDCSGCVGIAHTRWATHGEPSVRNAHPHCSQSGNLVIVHNGIIENFAFLRNQLTEKGFTFKSDTDTEVLIQLIEYAQQMHKCSLAQAVRIALTRCVGAYAIAVIDRRDPNTIVAARKGSPMVIGIGKDNSEFFIASDATPIAEYTKEVVYIDDEQIAVCHAGKPLEIIDLKNKPVDVDVKQIDMDLDMLDKGGFPHFMLKEIFDQPQCLRDCMRGRLFPNQHLQKKDEVGDAGVYNDVILSAVRNNRDRLLRAKRFIIVACGTSWHAGLIGKQLIEQYCKIPVEVDYASEFRYRDPVIYPSDVVIAISQSGETADTLAAVQLAKEAGAFIYGICNAIGSSIPRATDTGSYIHVGPEIGVASTKAFTGQVTVLTMLALALAKEKGTISSDDYMHIVKELHEIPAKIKEVLKLNDRIADLSRMFTYARNFLYLGRGFSYPVALEGALKLKEISYIHAEGYPAAEMKHGPIALIDSDMPVVVIATHNGMYEKVLSNIQEVKARKGKVIAVVSQGDNTISRIADEVIALPDTIECLEPLLATIPLQMLAYHVAVCKGLNVDQPRILAKSVTVE